MVPARKLTGSKQAVSPERPVRPRRPILRNVVSLDLGRILERNGPARDLLVEPAQRFPRTRIVHLDGGTVPYQIQCSWFWPINSSANGISIVVHDMITRRDWQAQTLEVV